MTIQRGRSIVYKNLIEVRLSRSLGNEAQKDIEWHSECTCVGCMLLGRGGNMLKTSVLAQHIFLYILFVICNLANNEKIKLMKIKKCVVREPNGVRAGTRAT